MTHRDPGAQKRSPGRAIPGTRKHNPDALSILPAWGGRGQQPLPHDATQAPSNGSANSASVPDSVVCHDKASLAGFLRRSVRSLDRDIAAGVIPPADFWCGRSPRWLPETVSRWLRSHPRLPGRRGGGA